MTTPNELAVRAAIKTLIEDNKATLVSGLVAQGQSRFIGQLTYSSLTPPNKYYFVSVSVNDHRMRNRENKPSTTANPLTEIEYDVLIEVSDYAIEQPVEDQLFENMDSQFQIFTDRIVGLIRENRWVEDTATTRKFRLLDPRLVNKNNLSSIWSDASDYHALLYSRITFSLVEECVGDAGIY